MLTRASLRRANQYCEGKRGLPDHLGTSFSELVVHWNLQPQRRRMTPKEATFKVSDKARPNIKA